MRLKILLFSILLYAFAACDFAIGVAKEADEQDVKDTFTVIQWGIYFFHFIAICSYLASFIFSIICLKKAAKGALSAPIIVLSFALSILVGWLTGSYLAMLGLTAPISMVVSAIPLLLSIVAAVMSAANNGPLSKK